MFEIEQYIHRRFDDYRYYGQPATDIQINCPFCLTEDTHFHLHINLTDHKRGVHCFRCDYRRSWINFVRDVDNVPYHVAFRELYVRPNPSQIGKFYTDLNQRRIDKKVAIEKTRRDLSSYGDFHYLSEKSSHDFVIACRTYLKKRRFDESYWDLYRLGTYLSGNYVARIIIPIEDDFFQGRAIYKYMKPRYLSPKDADNTTYLFNSGALRIFDEIVICEGAFSSMAVGENSVALVGKNPTTGKLRRLAESDVKSFIITVEKNAMGNMIRVAQFLIHEGRDVIIEEYENGDPADEFASSVRRTYSFSDKLLHELSRTVT